MRLITLFAGLYVLSAAMAMSAAATDIPFSDLASPEAREALSALHRAPPEPDARTDIEGLRRFHSDATDKLLVKMRETYSVSITPRKIGGINTQVVTPQAGVARNNTQRVLINLHGGAFTFGSGNGGLVESVPIAATERIEVIAVDYRLAPENKFPAATEDVAAVYRELLKTYRPENIGIYGCSAGGILAAESVAWFSSHGLPGPGAIASLCATGAEIDGDSSYVAPLLFGTPIPDGGHPLLLTSLPYFQGVDPKDPLAFPIVSPELLAKFPPTLLIAGNRDFSASSLTLMHRRLRAVDVDAELYLFDGMWHAFVVDSSLPESREVYGIVARFFDNHLGRRTKQVAAVAEGVGDCTTERLSAIAGPRLHIESVRSMAAAGPIGAHCAVAGYIEHGTRIGVTLGLPEQWNGKFLFLGVGGFAGTTAPLEGGVARGYATASTDTGHKGASVEDAAWALNNPAGIVNHFESSVEMAAQALKQLTSVYYRTLPAHSYFQGCSAGGRQGLVQAERFPASFDGIIAEAPAWSYSKLLVTFMANAQQVLKSADNWIPPQAFPEIDRVVLKQCDKLDGVEDGIIEDPRRCKPDLRALTCKSGERSPTCLTPAQIGTLSRLQRAGFAAGNPGYFGYYLTGSERSDPSWGWSEWFFGTRRPLPDASGQLNFALEVLPPEADRGKGPNQFILGEQFFRYFVMSDPRYDARRFNFARDEGVVQRRLGDVLDADRTDLGPFVRSGGKLLIWHGWSDPAIPPEMAIELYTRIMRDTRQRLLSLPIDESVRLFMVPGMQHCGGGTGLTDFDALGALEQWVEQGRAPDRIDAWQRVAGQRARSRPLCPYPRTAHFRGSGNSDDAANFDCN